MGTAGVSTHGVALSGCPVVAFVSSAKDRPPFPTLLLRCFLSCVSPCATLANVQTRAGYREVPARVFGKFFLTLCLDSPSGAFIAMMRVFVSDDFFQFTVLRIRKRAKSTATTQI